MMGAPPRQSLPDRVAQVLRDMIVTGELEWGKRVPIPELARDMSVSITPLREALKVLASEGLVELSPNRGARVASYTVEDARDLFEVIAGIESLAAKLAAERITPQEMSILEDMHDRMRLHFEAREKDAYFDLNSRIHLFIIACSGNRILRDTHASLMVRANRGRFIAITDENRWSEAMAEHEALMTALRQRDPAAAASIWQRHLQNTGYATIKALRTFAEAAEKQPA